MLRLQRVESAVENLRSNAGAAFNGDRTSTTRVAPRSSRPGDNSLENGTLEGVGEKIAADGSGREIGRLVFEKGESRYVSEGFWASLDLEVRFPVRYLALRESTIGVNYYLLWKVGSRDDLQCIWVKNCTCCVMIRLY